MGFETTNDPQLGFVEYGDIWASNTKNITYIQILGTTSVTAKLEKFENIMNYNQS